MLHKETVDKKTLELLIELQQKEYLEEFSLVGGTALALHLGHRKSIDLDLFSTTSFESMWLLENINADFPFQLFFSAQNTIKGSINQVQVDILSHRYPLISPPMQIDGIKLLSVEDIIAMKLNAISVSGQRVKDFIDIYFLLDHYSINDMISYYKLKYSLYNEVNVLKSLVWFEDVDLADWPQLTLEPKLKWDTIKAKITSHTKQYLKYI